MIIIYSHGVDKAGQAENDPKHSETPTTRRPTSETVGTEKSDLQIQNAQPTIEHETTCSRYL